MKKLITPEEICNNFNDQLGYELFTFKEELGKIYIFKSNLKPTHFFLVSVEDYGHHVLGGFYLESIIGCNYDLLKLLDSKRNNGWSYEHISKICNELEERKRLKRFLEL